MATNKTQTADTNDQSEGRSITPKDLAEQLNVSPKALRAFVRSIVTNSAGKGGAWRFTAEEAATIADRFNNRQTSRSTAPMFKSEDD